ncbi:MAG: NAD-dependent succinate-semialdehyde dehydrogenase [Bacteroidota bacterium]|nr:NAD-dependent succinate-semialdehyde dehydrogenase [Bacteroidota bacterium]MDP4190569.1 NAD-dependent succinate-semialdehyde dehydrogenase [Bacteroidota bacterium]MDP4194228.1 NAD-dependent succinate-semialdehyde dehydrogenase [Bacteroidota bacterium]
MPIKSINPATGEVIKVLDELTEDQVYQEIDKAYSTFQSWKKTSYKERRAHLKKASTILKDEKYNYAKILTLEMGKPIRQAVSEVEKCAWVCEYYADNIEKILKKEVIQTDASESYVEFDPLGVVLAIMPWNFPYWQVFRFAAPALVAGNVGLLKHSSNVPMSALAIEEIFMKAGFPSGTFKTLLVGSSRMEDIINHPKVSAVTLTGSEGAGKKVASAAGKNLKKTVLELGGSDPFIVLADADIEAASNMAVKSRIINNGQSCIAAKRFIVVKEIAKQFEERFVEIVNDLKIGDPMDERNDLGPIAREDLLLTIDEQVKQSVKMGAKLLSGGKRLEVHGYYYPATVLSDVKKGMPVYEQETFGPIAAIIVAEDQDDAIRIANDSPYGLGASLWTRNLSNAKELASRIESGSVFINGMVKSDPRLPFGGIKISGYGRELSHYGIKEFINIKTVWIA